MYDSDGLKRLLGRFSGLLNGCCSLHQLGSNILNIKADLATIRDKMKDYGINNIVTDRGESSAAAGHNRNWARKTFPKFEIEECFVGMKDELERLVSLVVDDKDDQHRVISVWGMGGIGKTTLARKVYNQTIEAKNRRFDRFAWVCITQQCHVTSILEDVLEQLKGESVSGLRETQLIEQLCQIQRAKRCLIVLDDLWETSHWNEGLKHLVQDLKTKILVTTRKQKVAEIGFTLELGLLNVDDAWELLKKKAFPHANSNFPDFAHQERIHKLGKEMVGKCGCLPLAISLLGGLLSKKNSMSEWELVNENINAFIYRGGGLDEKDNQIDAVLNLSYENLPHYLKQCFLYLGILKEGESIYVRILYQMWIAQGMISYNNIKGKEETLMDIAELYLSELASRCIVQVEDSLPTKKNIKCKLHDVVRELCLSKGRNEEFGVQTLEYEVGNFSKLLQEALSNIRTRYLAIHFERELQLERGELTAVTREEDSSKHLRFLKIRSHIKGETIEFPPQSMVDFQNFKLLRSLVVVRFKFPGRKLPEGITHLFLLRYLRLHRCELDKLPSSITNLTYLNTLDLFHSWNVRVPNVLKKMPRLKHLTLPSYDEKTIGNYRLRLDGGLDELESLLGFNSCVHELKSIMKMKNLRNLSASISDNESLSAIMSSIAAHWNKLVFCAVEIKPGCQLTTSEEGLTNLKRAFSCPNLYTLSVCVGLGKLLTECRSEMITSKLTSLFLSECGVEDDPMGILGKLPSLTELCFNSRSFVGEEMRCPAFSFPSLKRLELNDLPNLREWGVEKGALPLVSRIHIRCPRLEMVPDGMSSVFTLKKLTIQGMPELGKRVLASGEDFHKVRHVPSIFIHD